MKKLMTMLIVLLLAIAVAIPLGAWADDDDDDDNNDEVTCPCFDEDALAAITFDSAICPQSAPPSRYPQARQQT